MPRFKFLVFIFSALLFNSCKIGKVVSIPASTPIEVIVAVEPTLLIVGEESINQKEMVTVLDNYLLTDSSGFEEIFDDIIKQKRIYLAAKDQGYTNNAIALEELNSYKRILATSFIQDTSLVNGLSRLTYQRMKKEINASHILLALPLYASPNDTLAAYNKLLELKDEISNGASFDSLAQLYSADRNTKDLGGNMGWFSALQLIFPLENAAYQTQKGQVSVPVRTQAGYHILKVNDSRHFSGQVQVSHILKAVPENAGTDFEAFQKNALDSLYTLIQGGTSFEALCRTNSDDTFNRENDGALNPFSIGSRQERSFEEVAFSLKIGEVSKPLRTSIGWHLIKLTKVIPLASYDSLEGLLIRKVTTDSRGRYLETKGFEKYFDQLNFVKQEANYSEVIAMADARILDRKWFINRSSVQEKALFTVADTVYSNYDFITFAEDKQTFEHQNASYDAATYLRWFYADFEKTKVQKAVVDNLHLWNVDYKNMVNAYQQSLTVSSFMNENIYEKSVTDTTGLRLYFEQNKNKYLIPRKAKATIIKANSKELVSEYYHLASSGTPYRLKRGIKPLYFNKNQFALSDEMKRKLTGLILLMERNPTFIVEVGGHHDVNEESNVSASRVGNIVTYLQESGLDITRIQEYDYGQTGLVDQFDWAMNQRASFQFFSNNKTDLVKVLNNGINNITISSSSYFEEENDLIDGTDWEIGEYETTFDDHYYRIEIEEISIARNLTFKEARGAIISDYQKELEEQLMADLTVKYPISLNEERKIKTLYKDYLKNNQ